MADVNIDNDFDYDLIVIGSGPSGQKAAVQAAKLRKKVAIIEASKYVGGVWTNTGTIPSKSFREAVMYLSGYRERKIYGTAYRVKSDITMHDLTFRIENIVQNENRVIENQLRRNHIEILSGHASLIDQYTVKIESPDTVVTKRAKFIVLAVGSKPNHPATFEVDGAKILDSDSVLNLKELPRNMLVVGGGVIGVEYASMFAALGIKVTLVEAKKELLTFIDEEIVETLQYHLRNLGIVLRLGEEVLQVSKREDGQVVTTLKSGKKIITEVVMICAGRQGATADLNLESVGIIPEKYGRIKVNEHYQTSVSNIYAAGDVIGFPALASTSMLQGRSAACHAFNVPDESKNAPLPYGIYTIPEISIVGETEATLTEQQIPYETGVAKYKESARGNLIGDELGMLKLIFHRDTLKLLGVHIIGESATELIHLGQAVLYFNGGIDYFVSSVFNNPTLTECYKVAALDGFNKVNS